MDDETTLPEEGEPAPEKIEDPEETAADRSRRDMDAWVLEKARRIYRTSTDYVDANISNKWETNLAHFRSEHAPGSPLARQGLKRSKVFRPRTRASVKGQEAALAVAAFASQDLLVVTPEDPKDERQRISAKINQNLLQKRLQDRMPWFQTAIGAFQDTKVYGVCISHQFWRYEEDVEEEIEVGEDGEPVLDEDGSLHLSRRRIPTRDELVCDLIAPENFKFDAACDWRDPANTSPYLIYEMPLYAGDVLERMEQEDPKTGAPAWRKHGLAEILATRRKNYDRTRQAREGNDRRDPADEHDYGEYTLVWAHMNIVRERGRDVLFWTLGTEMVLSDPVPLEEVYPHLEPGERPFTIGFSTIEAHRNYPSGDVEQSSQLQQELNTVANQRIDNVKLALNKRYHVRRGAQVDLEALIRNVPGGGVMMTDPEKDVQVVSTPDVTRSSYVEQDRLSSEMDELTGSFGQQSAQASRNAGGTVGGMSMIQQSAGAVQDYGIRVFLETWMEPALNQMLRLIQLYETDEMLLSVAARNSDLWLRFGTDQVDDSILQRSLNVHVDVGIGNTDPVRRVERLAFGIEKVINLPGMAERSKSLGIANEVFGALGYKTANQFFMDDEELKREMEGKPQMPNETEMEMRELDLKEKESTERHERELMKIEKDFEARMAEIATKEKITLEQLYKKLGLDQERMQTQREIAALREMNKTREMNMKARTGSGI